MERRSPGIALAICYGMIFLAIVALLIILGSVAFTIITVGAVGIGAFLGTLVSTDEAVILVISIIAMTLGLAFFIVSGDWVFLAGIATFWLGTVAYGLGLGGFVRASA